MLCSGEDVVYASLFRVGVELEFNHNHRMREDHVVTADPPVMPWAARVA